MRARARAASVVGVVGALLAGFVVPADAQTTPTTAPQPASCTNVSAAISGNFLQPPWSDAGGWSAPSRYETITTGDVDGDGRTELLGRDGVYMEVYGWAAGTDGNPDPEQYVAGAVGPTLSDQGGWDQPQYYSTIQTGDIDGNGTDDIIARDGTNLIAFTLTGGNYATGTWNVLPKGPAWSDAAGWDQAPQYGTIHAGDVDGNGTDDVIGLDPDLAAIDVATYDAATATWSTLPSVPPFVVWGISPAYWTSIQLADLDGNGTDEILGRGPEGIVAFTFVGGSWTMLPPFPTGQEWSDANGWGDPEQYGSIRTGDVDGDGRAEVVGLSDTALETWSFDGSAWEPAVPDLAAFPQATWDQPQYYETLQLGDVTGDGADDLLARGPSGLQSWSVSQGTWGMLAATFPTLSDANGWDDPARYSTIRAIPLIDGQAGALVARTATGMGIWQPEGTAPAAAWTVPSMPVPEWVSSQSDPNDPLQVAYAYINQELDLGGPVLEQLDRTDILQSLQFELGQLKPAGLNITRDQWDEVYDAVNGWVADAVDLNAYFFDANQSLNSLATQQLMLTSDQLQIIKDQYFDISGGEEIVAIVSEILAGIIGAVGSALDPGVLVVVLALASAALSSWEGFPDPQASINAKYDDLLGQIDTAFCSSVFFLNQAFDEVTGDLGHLGVAGDLVQSGTWGFTGNTYDDAVAAMDTAQQIWAFQQFGSVAWRAGHCEPNGIGDFFCDFSSTDTNAYLPPLGEFQAGPVAWKVVGTFSGSVDCVKSTDSGVTYLRDTLGVQLSDIFSPLDPVTGQALSDPTGTKGWSLKVDSCN
jgi:hypothetical protein